MAKKQLYWEDVKEGMDITPLVKHPTTQTLVMWAGACGDFYQIHYDTAFAHEKGLPGVIVHGALKHAWLGQMLVDWIGEAGTLKKYGCQYRGMDVPWQPLTCTGKVTKTYVQGKEHLVDCDIWTETAKGEKTSPGTATVALPSRARARAR